MNQQDYLRRVRVRRASDVPLARVRIFVPPALAPSYVPALKFNDKRNSQYVGQLV